MADRINKNRAKAIMIQGTMSNAGKSLLCTGLCRIFKQDGFKVAPFKSQNMALNSAITSDGLEMGRAQYVQAEAAGIEPSVLMNPILLKPVTTMGSQLIVRGEVRGTGQKQSVSGDQLHRNHPSHKPGKSTSLQRCSRKCCPGVRRIFGPGIRC